MHTFDYWSLKYNQETQKGKTKYNGFLSNSSYILDENIL